MTINNGVCETKLPDRLDTEHYLCGVITLSGKLVHTNYRKSDRLFLCSDLCQQSFVHEAKVPTLCEIYRKENGLIINDFKHILWLQVIHPCIDCVKLYILDEEGKPVSVERGTLKCTLVLAFDHHYQKRIKKK